MNRINKESLLHRAADTARNLKTHAAVASVALMASPFVAFAAAPDTTPITTKITTYVAAGVIVILAFAAGVWGMRAAGLMGKR